MGSFQPTQLLSRGPRGRPNLPHYQRITTIPAGHILYLSIGLFGCVYLFMYISIYIEREIDIDSFIHSFIHLFIYSFIYPIRYYALCSQLLQASQFFMLDSLKRHCERLAAGHLDCENVVDTCAYAKVSKWRGLERGVVWNMGRRRTFLHPSVSEK